MFVEKVQNDDSKLCVFEVIPTKDGVKLADPTGECRSTDCGARHNNTLFKFTERTKAASDNK
jgi:hypothetical protein